MLELLAQEAGGGGTDFVLPLLGQLGVFTPIAAVFWWVINREAKRADRMEEKVLAVIPLLAELNSSSQEILDYARAEKQKKEVNAEVDRRLKTEGA